MKQLKFFIPVLVVLGLYIFTFCPSSSLWANDAVKQKPNFGKTHFIVGYDDYDLELDDDQSTRTDIPDEPLQEGVIALDKNGKLCAALFAPDHNLRIALRQLIKQEQEKIVIAIFAFTDIHVARELIAAHKKGIVIEVITDPSCLRSQHHKIDHLQEVGIPIYVYKSDSKGQSSIMHNKFAVFSKSIHGKPVVWTGSFNFTKSGSDVNQENVVVMDEEKIVKQYVDQFDKLKERAEKLGKSTKITMNKKCSITTIPS